MPAGRPPKPVEEKRRLGNPGRRPLPEPLSYLPAVSGTPKVPVGLKIGGKRLWTQIYDAARVWVSDLDQAEVEVACRLFDDIASYRRLVTKHGPLLEEPITTPTGVEVGIRLVANPAVKMLRDAEKQWQSCMADLCIPPAARARLGLAQVKAQSKLEEILARRNAAS